MKWGKRLLFVLSALLVGIQFVRPPLVNPRVDERLSLYASTTPVPADVRGILDRSCSDCHSDKTVWPWYSHVAPASWLVVDDVTEARKELNFSVWCSYTPKRKAHKLEEICEQVKEKAMPLEKYTFMHPSAKLSDTERGRLCEWAELTRKGSV